LELGKYIAQVSCGNNITYTKSLQRTQRAYIDRTYIDKDVAKTPNSIVDALRTHINSRSDA